MKLQLRFPDCASEHAIINMVLNSTVQRHPDTGVTFLSTGAVIEVEELATSKGRIAKSNQ